MASNSEEGACIKVINGTSSNIGGHELMLCYQTEEQIKTGGTSMTGIHSIKANNEIIAQLASGSPFETNGIVAKWGLALMKKGFLFEGYDGNTDLNNQIKIDVFPDGVYKIIVDKDNMPLTLSEKEIITRLLFQRLETHIGYPDIWKSVYEEILHDDNGSKLDFHLNNRSLDQFIDVYDHGRGVSMDWQNYYSPIVPEQWASFQTISSEIKIGGNARIDLYWRALGRFPGGNADFHTCQYSFNCSSPTASFRDYSNWDGSHSNSEQQISYSTERFSSIFEGISKSIESFSDPIDSECTLLDSHSMDSEEYDSEWTSQEILIFLPRVWNKETHFNFPLQTRQEISTFLLVNHRFTLPLPKDLLEHIFQYVAPSKISPVFRLHRRCVMGGQGYSWSLKNNPPAPHYPPSKSQGALLDVVEKVIGMGRVNTFTDAGDGEGECQATMELKSLEENANDFTCDYRINFPYLQPLYFRWTM